MTRDVQGVERRRHRQVVRSMRLRRLMIRLA
jgi:hypothetical protein